MKKLVLIVCLCNLTQVGYAQFIGNEPLSLSDDNLSFYLLQAFHATDPRRRISLNHIGIQGRFQNSQFLVTAVLEGYPAHLIGIERGDIVLEVNDQPFHPVHSFNIERDTTGSFTPEISEYHLVFKRGTVITERKIMPVFENLFDSYRTATANSVLEFSAGNKVIGYIRFWALSRNSNDIINYQNLIRGLDHCDGIIFDLRNSFGFLDSQHLDLVFNDKNNYFSIDTATSNGINFSQISTTLDFENYRKPIAVLVNEDTQGGAELFAYQLAKLERVVTLGAPTPGVIGTFEINQNETGSRIEYTPAPNVLIDNNPFEGTGITPEIKVQFPYESTARGDPQYEAAINALLSII